METEIEKVLPVTEKEDGNVAVDARMLYTFLESKRQFSNWIKDRIEKCDLIENEDFVSFNKIVKRETGATTMTEYALSLDAAKEISMMEGNDKGKKARRYFIACEKKLKQSAVMPKDYPAALRALADQYEKNQKLAQENKVLQPKGEYYDLLVNNEHLLNFTDYSKELGVMRKYFILYLKEHHYVYKNGLWLPYADKMKWFAVKNIAKGKFAGKQTFLTVDGQAHFLKMKDDILNYQNTKRNQ